MGMYQSPHDHMRSLNSAGETYSVTITSLSTGQILAKNAGVYDHNEKWIHVENTTDDVTKDGTIWFPISQVAINILED